MSKNKQGKFLNERSKKPHGWEAAIHDTETRIVATKNRLTELKAALAVFKQRRDDGEPFPGEHEGQREAKS